jgi:drug/metabolite transporter (DMT)-like permease
MVYRTPQVVARRDNNFNMPSFYVRPLRTVMKFRFQILLFAAFVLVGAIVLWFFSPITTISSDGIKSTNHYWWWLAGVYFVAAGCAAEYLFFKGCDLLSSRLSRSQKIVAGTVLASISVIAASYGLFQYYHR